MDSEEREFRALVDSVIPMMYELQDELSPELRALPLKEFRQVMVWVYSALAWECGEPKPLATLIQFGDIPPPLRNMVAHIVSGWREPRFANSRKSPSGEMRALLMQSLWVNSKFHKLEKFHTEKISDALDITSEQAQSKVHQNNREALARIIKVTGADLGPSSIEKVRAETSRFYADLGVIAVK